MPQEFNKSMLLVGMLMFALPLFFVNCSEVGFQQASKSDATIQDCTGQPECDQVGGGGSGGGGPDDDDGGDSSDPPLPSVVTPQQFSVTAPPASNQVDILLVIDNSGSMEIEREALASRLDQFVTNLDAAGLDWRMCHTYTDRTRAIRWDGLGSRVLTSSTQNKNQIFRDSLIGISEGSGDEQGIRASYENLRNSNNAECFRPDGALAIIVLSDEDERSCGQRSNECLNNDYEVLRAENKPETLINYVGSRWQQAKPFSFHSIVIKPALNGMPADSSCQQTQRAQNHAAYYGVEYAKVSTQTGGVVGSICESNYSSQLDLIGERIEDTLATLPLACSPHEGQISVSIVDASGNPLSNQAALDGNKLVFTPALPAGAVVTGSYGCLEYL